MWGDQIGIRRGALALAAFVAVALSAWAVLVLTGDTRMRAEALPETCRSLTFEEAPYIVCEVDVRAYEVGVHHKDGKGKPFGNLAALSAAQPFLFAMNAGMYHEDLSPVGLHVEDGVELAPLNTADAPGNFFMKPNGVFFVDREGRAGVQETGAFAASGADVRMATQSGPMLVIDGSLHPRFEPNGSSRYIRNGVGVRDPQTAVFAISTAEVSLGSFARLFQDELDCANALFFDGGISALHDGKRYLVGGEHPAGPMVSVRAT